MRVLIACEFSGRVRDAFILAGHEAYSCDILPSESDFSLNHFQCDIFEVLNHSVGRWDLMIAHPPCTHICASGASSMLAKRLDGRQGQAVSFAKRLILCESVPRIAVENPVGILSRRVRRPEQIIQPWLFGEKASKKTCLWLKNLPLLQPTNIVEQGERTTYASGKTMPTWYNAKGIKDRAKYRSITFQGIANAMADQWGKLDV